MNQIKPLGEGAYLLSCPHSSYLLEAKEGGRLNCLHFGERLERDETVLSLLSHRPLNAIGTALIDEGEYPARALGELFLPSRDEKRRPSILVSCDGVLASSFRSVKAEIKGASAPLPNLPFPHGKGEELVVYLKEEALPITLELHYVLFPDSDVIGRYLTIRNDGDGPLTIRRASSFALSFYPSKPLVLSSFHGGWADELHEERRPLSLGGTFLRSDSGSSSNENAPYFLLAEEGATEEKGRSYAFSLLYSGSFEMVLERDRRGRVSLSGGVGSDAFEKVLLPRESFVAPMALMAFSDLGYGGLTAAFSLFTKNHLLPARHASKARPIIYNNWEATSFSFTEGKIRSLMRKAGKLGIELFVLDDGWFKGRKDDKGGLGDWEEDRKKLPHGLKGLASYAKKLGLSFGIWMEPEMVSPQSDLYKAHPDWAMRDAKHVPLLGRNQLILDLTKKEARDYVVTSVSKILSIPGVSYLKWDYNRPFGARPSFSYDYDYMLGLYEVLGRIRRAFPNALIENCASGGNRFDHAMLCYFDQSWLSDCTDPYERLRIERSASYLFPPIVFGNHVSAKTNNQTLRRTSLETKFDAACFGTLGYELDLGDLSPLEEDIIKKQTAFYKKHREAFQNGSFLRLSEWGTLPLGVESFEALDAKEAVIGRFVGVSDLSRGETSLRARGLDPSALYHVSLRPESVSFLAFGHLVNTLSPVHLAEEGLVITRLSRYKSMWSKEWEGIAEGTLLNGAGLPLPSAWQGTGYDEGTRLELDFSGSLFVLNKKA